MDILLEKYLMDLPEKAAENEPDRLIPKVLMN